MTENNQKKQKERKKPEEKKEQGVRPISYSCTYRSKENSEDKPKRGYEEGKKETQREQEKKSPSPRRSFVVIAELADAMNNPFRRSKSNGSAAAATAVCGS